MLSDLQRDQRHNGEAGAQASQHWGTPMMVSHFVYLAAMLTVCSLPCCTPKPGICCFSFILVMALYLVYLVVQTESRKRECENIFSQVGLCLLAHLPPASTGPPALEA